MSTPVPRVTVAMPVYNGAATVARAIDSILQQTFRDFELVLIDDGCSDNTIDIVRSYNDPRIRLIMHETNQGLAATRNHLVDQARGEFIARAPMLRRIVRLGKQFKCYARCRARSVERLLCHIARKTFHKRAMLPPPILARDYCSGDSTNCPYWHSRGRSACSDEMV